MIFCTRCGTKNDDNLNFCLHCGYALENEGYIETGIVENNPNKGKAVASMVLGIISCALCWGYGVLGLVPGIIGLVFATKLRKDPDTFKKNTGILNAGLICSIIGIVLSGLILCFYTIGIIIFLILGGVGFGLF